METLPKTVLYYGSEKPLPEPQGLRAGPLSLRFDDGSLRHIRLGDHDVLLQIYSTVRDHNWRTIVPQITLLSTDIRADSFELRFQSEHIDRDINFTWQGAITGDSEGTIIFAMDGQAHSTFLRNRIGFCVLHSMNCAGKPCQIETTAGDRIDGQFPLNISPHQPYKNIRAIRHEIVDGMWAEVRMEGDVFEMEDQRNWTDASYKTYCTPLGLPIPVKVETDTKIAQTITLTLHGDIRHSSIVSRVSSDKQTPITFRTIVPGGYPMPRLGLGVASHGNPLSSEEIERLRTLRLHHLRVDLWLSDASYESRLASATDEANKLGVKLEMALHLTDMADAELASLRQVVDRLKPPICWWLVFHELEKSTTARWVTLARQYLADYMPAALIGAGTDGYFTELNRERPPVETLDLVTYSLNPQVHAFDNTTLVESLKTQAVTVASARTFVGNLPLLVSPVTLKMRSSRGATGADDSRELPPTVDVRQMSLFGAGWTLGSIKYLSESHVHSITYYETSGWRGVMETSQGTRLPDRFRSIEGSVFPVYHILAAVGEFAEGEIVPAQSSHRLEVDGLVLRKHNQIRVMLANYTAEKQQIHLPELQSAASIWTLDETNAERAMRFPEVHRMENSQPIEANTSGLIIEMRPFAVLCIDAEDFLSK